MTDGFQRVLDHIRSIADTEVEKGRLFERLMKAYFQQDPLYRDRFADVRLWSEWAATRPEFDGADIGIDLVAEERAGGVCAIQCKCYAPGTRISKAHLDSFISASAREPFTSLIVVDTGDGWGPNAVKTVTGLDRECTVLRFGDLASRPFDWPDLVRDEPEALSWRAEPYSLRPHQQDAFDDTMAGFAEHDRGKLVMACGTGKTFAALRIAEAAAGIGGRVLYLVPSISLFQQSMREWAEQRSVPHRYVGICSDTRAGRNDEDATLQELEIPVTTDPDAIGAALREAPPDVMTAVFCTYHSLGLVERAQDEGTPPFDLVLCDEAHRTTGIERPGDRTSPFVLVHDAERIRAAKRLYMTATPRIYTEGARARAATHDVEVFSMDDPATYGPEFHRLPFSRAVEQDLLSDYKVVVLAMSERHVDAALQAHLAAGGGEINLTDAAKIVGCWRALQNPENRDAADGPVRPLGRAIAFTNTIKSSRLLETHWDGIVAQAVEMMPEAERPGAFRCETRHVDGQHHALDRKARIEWLKGRADGTCRILSNARCLSEGIDVPALDAVLFMSPRNSQVDIVQAVGRAMRKARARITAISCCRSRCRPASRRRRRSTTTNASPRSGACCGRCARTTTGWTPRSTRSTSTTGRPPASSSASRIRRIAASTKRRRFPSRRSIFRPARSTPRSSRSAATENTGKTGPRTSPTSSRAWSPGSKACSTTPTMRRFGNGSRRSTASSRSRSTSRSTATARST